MARRSFVEKTLLDLSAAIERTVYAEELARRPGLLQRLDPRIKLVLCGFAIVVAASLRHPVLQIVLVVAALVLALLTRIPAQTVVRIALGLPLFTLVVTAPAMVLVPGPALVPLPFGLAVSEPGARSVATILLRVSASVLLASLLVLTTRWSELLAALRALHAPAIFVLVLAMAYRYLFVLLDLTQDLLLARRARLIAPSKGAEQRRWLAAALGVLFQRSIRTSDQVYLAMLARGFRGDYRSLQPRPISDSEWLTLSLAAVALAMLWLLDLSRP